MPDPISPTGRPVTCRLATGGDVAPVRDLCARRALYVAGIVEELRNFREFGEVVVEVGDGGRGRRIDGRLKVGQTRPRLTVQPQELKMTRKNFVLALRPYTTHQIPLPKLDCIGGLVPS